MGPRRRAILRTEEHTVVELEDMRLPCLLRRSSARDTVAMRVDLKGQVVVNLPMAMPLGPVRAFLRQHQGWLQRQLEQVRCAEVIWQQGLLLPYLGETLELVERPAMPLPQRLANWLCVPSIAQAGESVPAWYRAQAKCVLAERLHELCQRHGLPRLAWRLSDARTRWGSLSAQGVVSLNWRLVKASHAEIDYVICHELAHLRQRNHSAAFWREVAALCPNYRAARGLLRRNGRRYFQF